MLRSCSFVFDRVIEVRMEVETGSRHDAGPRPLHDGLPRGAHPPAISERVAPLNDAGIFFCSTRWCIGPSAT